MDQGPDLGCFPNVTYSPQFHRNVRRFAEIEESCRLLFKSFPFDNTGVCSKL